MGDDIQTTRLEGNSNRLYYYGRHINEHYVVQNADLSKTCLLVFSVFNAAPEDTFNNSLQFRVNLPFSSRLVRINRVRSPSLDITINSLGCNDGQIQSWARADARRETLITHKRQSRHILLTQEYDSRPQKRLQHSTRKKVSRRTRQGNNTLYWPRGQQHCVFPVEALHSHKVILYRIYMHIHNDELLIINNRVVHEGTYMRAMCSEISAQNRGTRALRDLRACCLSNGSGSESKASTPAAEDCERATMNRDREEAREG